MRLFLYTLVIALLAAAQASAQWELRGSMGLNITTSPDVRDYLNANDFAPPGEDAQTFQSAIEFAVEADYILAPTSQVGLEFAYQLNAFNYSGFLGEYELSYTVLAPTLMYHIVLPGAGYKFKFGAGVGPRFTSASERQYITETLEYSSTGFGGVLAAQGATALSADVYAYIAGDIRYNALGTPERDGRKFSSGTTEEVSFNNFSVGLKLGVLLEL